MHKNLPSAKIILDFSKSPQEAMSEANFDFANASIPE